jgi:hypothetical protein
MAGRARAAGPRRLAGDIGKAGGLDRRRRGGVRPCRPLGRCRCRGQRPYGAGPGVDDDATAVDATAQRLAQGSAWW